MGLFFMSVVCVGLWSYSYLLVYLFIFSSYALSQICAYIGKNIFKHVVMLSSRGEDFPLLLPNDWASDDSESS